MKKKFCKFNSLIFLIFIILLPIGLIFHLYFYSQSENPIENKFYTNNEINNPSASIYEHWNGTIDGTATDSDDRGRGVCVDTQGNVYFAGYIENTGTDNDIILRKYNKTGDLVWENITDGPYDGTPDNDIAYDVAVDDNYNVYITGSMANTSSFSVCFLMKSITGNMVHRKYVFIFG